MTVGRYECRAACSARMDERCWKIGPVGADCDDALRLAEDLDWELRELAEGALDVPENARWWVCPACSDFLDAKIGTPGGCL